MSSKLAYLSKYTQAVCDTTAIAKEKKKSKKHKKKSSERKRKNTDLVLEFDDDAILPPPPDDDNEENEEENLPTIVDIGSSVSPCRSNENLTDKTLTVDTASQANYRDSDGHRRRQLHSDRNDPPRRKRYDSGLEERKGGGRRFDSDEEDLPETKSKNANHEPPSVRRHLHDSDDEESAIQTSRKHRYDSDDEQRPTQRNKRFDSDDEDSRTRMSSGHNAGLQHAGDFREAEIMIQEIKKEATQSMIDRQGVGETVYRDDLGRKVDEVKNKKQPKMDQREQALLNKGRAQKEEEARIIMELNTLKESSFARHADDEGMNDMFRDELRDGDPMAAHSEARSTIGRPAYKGPPPKPNRYGIQPGYRWDGVDRGNGFEDKVLARKFSSQRKTEDSYRWSSADM